MYSSQYQHRYEHEVRVRVAQAATYAGLRKFVPLSSRILKLVLVLASTYIL